MSSSSGEDPLGPMNTFVEQLQEKVMEGAPWAIAIIVISMALWVAVPWAWSLWWYRKNPLAGKMQRRRQQLSDLFGLTIKRVRRDGRIRISPGETGRWQREGLAEELGAELGTPVRIKTQGGYAWVRGVQRIGDIVEGCPSYVPKEGKVIIGVSVEDGSPDGFSLREISGIVVGARPGEGKTVLLQQLQDALKGHADVVTIDGKTTSLGESAEVIRATQKEMTRRFACNIDFWKNSQGFPLRVLVLDECQQIFDASSENKADKNDAKERVRIVRDLVQRGRSAGVITVLATQRMSADVIPTAVRDLATVRICGRVTGDDSRLVMGRLPEPGEPNPSRLKPRRIVVDDGDGVWREVHVFERHNG
ncbi:AAA family ATPase [Corynebacterium tuberculostearicum]|nr:AAA family ATPase [Corynebacterium tuberculostearicum]